MQSYVLHHILYNISPGNGIMPSLIFAAHFYFAVAAKYYFSYILYWFLLVLCNVILNKNTSNLQLKIEYILQFFFFFLNSCAKGDLNRAVSCNHWNRYTEGWPWLPLATCKLIVHLRSLYISNDLFIHEIHRCDFQDKSHLTCYIVICFSGYWAWTMCTCI